MRAFAVIGLGFGDEGKGSIVDYVAREEKADLVVFFNGGSQRGHNVVTEDGRHHTFSQFGSGTFAGTRTFHSRHSLVNPLSFITEGVALQRKNVPEPFDLVTIDAHCPITTPFHGAANRIRERARGDARHGSCGLGIGETVADAKRGVVLWAGALRAGVAPLVGFLAAIQKRKAAELKDLQGSYTEDWRILTDPNEPQVCAEAFFAFAELVDIVDNYNLSQFETVVFEGGQGVLLDETYGFHPHTTWSDCTFANVDAILAPYDVIPSRIGVTRAYATRHGAGPFPTEDPDLTFPGEHNQTDAWQGEFRRGYTDLLLLRYAAQVLGGIDTLAITCLDQVPAEWKVCDWYDDRNSHTRLARGDPLPVLADPPYAFQEHLGIMLGQLEAQYVNIPKEGLPLLLELGAGTMQHPVRNVIESRGPTAAAKFSRAGL